MTPSKRGNVTSIRIEKVKRSQIDHSQVAHTAGGQHSGLVINKQTAAGFICLHAFQTKSILSYIRLCNLLCFLGKIFSCEVNGRTLKQQS